MKKQAIVVGSGISGLAISNMLKNSHDVKVLEKSDKTGGLIKCVRVNGNLFHLVGGHVFNSKNAAVLKWFWDYFDRDTEFLKATRNAKILMDDKIIGYPIENFIYQLPEKQAQNIINELLELYTNNDDPKKSNDFKAFLEKSFGKTLYDLYFGPYNTKIWQTDLGKMPLNWLDGKLPMPDVKDILLSNIIKKQETDMVHSSFYYPVVEGSQFIVNRFAETLDIELSTPVSSVKYQNGMLSVNDGQYSADILVYCGDVRMLMHIININDPKLTDSLLAVSKLPSNGTTNVLCETDDCDISWLYLPEEKFKAHRIIYTGNFSATNNAGTGRKTCVVEFSGKHDKEQVIEELKLLPGNLKPVSVNYEPNSYIIHEKETEDMVITLKADLEKYNIYLLGRFAEWGYFNMDKCIENAMELANKINSNRL